MNPIRIIQSVRLIAMALVIAAFAVTARGDSAVGGQLASPEGASVGFANLSDGDVVPPEFTVEFTIDGMDLAPAGTKAANTGHHHLLIDVDELPALDQPLPSTDRIRHFGKAQTQTKLQLSEGQHTLQLLLGDYAHRPHEPPVMSERITITVSSQAAAQGGVQGL